MMAMHLDLMKEIVYITSDPNIDGTDFSKVLWQGLLFKCGLPVSRWSALEDVLDDTLRKQSLQELH